MYFLAMEIAGFRQLSRVNPELIRRLERDTTALIEASGGDRLSCRGGVSMYRFRLAGAHELAGLSSTAWSVASRLADHEADLFGYTLCLDHVMASDEEQVVTDMERLLRKAPQEGGLWLGPNAATPLTPFLRLERRLDLWKAVGMLEGAEVLPELSSFVDNSTVLPDLLDELNPVINGEEATSCVLLYGAEGSGVAFLARRACASVNGGTEPPVILPLSNTLEPALAFASLSDCEHFRRVEEFLHDSELLRWRRCCYALEGAWSAPPGRIHPDCPLSDLEESLCFFVETYVSRMSAEARTAILLVEELDRLDDRFHSLLVRACNRVLESGQLLLIATSSRPFVPAPMRSLDYRKVAVRTMSRDAISATLGALPPELHRDSLKRVRVLSRGRLLHLYHYLWLVERGEKIDETEELTDALAKSLMKALDSAESEALYTASIGYGLLSSDRLSKVLVSLGHSKVVVAELWSALAAAGFVRDARHPLPVYSSCRGYLSEQLAARARVIESALADEAYEAFRLGALELSPDRYRLVAGNRDSRVSYEAYCHFADELLRRGEVELFDALLGGDIEAGSCANDPQFRADVHAFTNILQLSAALREEDARRAEQIYVRWQEWVDSAIHDHTAIRVGLERAYFQLAAGNSEEADRLARRAVRTYQEKGDVEGAAEAQIAFGSVQLRAGRIMEARDYFFMARSDGSACVPRLFVLRAVALEAVAMYIYGNYSLAIELADKAISLGEATCNRDWELFSRFVRSRVDFELGRYEHARERLSEAALRARHFAMVRAANVIEVWSLRACAYAGDAERAVAGLTVNEGSDREFRDVPERTLFLAESYALQGRNDDAIASLDGRVTGDEPRLRSTRVARWTNGFDGIEASVGESGPAAVLEQFTRAFHGYLLGQSGRVEDAVTTLRSCTREGALSPHDPNAPLLYYWYAKVLPETRDRRFDDPATELGRSVRLVQQRASRTDTPSDKNDYRRRNHWYRDLFEMAGHYNLA